MPRFSQTVILVACTASTFATSGRAPGAVNLRTREIECAIKAEGKPGRDKRLAIAWPDRAGPG